MPYSGIITLYRHTLLIYQIKGGYAFLNAYNILPDGNYFPWYYMEKSKYLWNRQELFTMGS